MPELCSRSRMAKAAGLTVYGNSLDNELRVHIQWKSQSAPHCWMRPLGDELPRIETGPDPLARTFWLEYGISGVTAGLLRAVIDRSEREGSRQKDKRVCERLPGWLPKGKYLN